MSSITPAKAKQLCTAAEFRLVKASRRRDDALPGAAQLKREVVQARKLRDKWRDQYEKQRRAQQQDSRETPGETRSREKAELFADALGRFETQLKQSADSGRTSPTPTAPTSKKKRTSAHREARAQTKKQLGEKRETLQRKMTAAAATTAETAAATSPEAKPAPQAGPKKPGKKSAKKKAGKPAVPKSATSPTAGPTKGKKSALPSAAGTAAKQQRIKLSGLTTRTRGHVIARGKRNQARRDQRN